MRELRDGLAITPVVENVWQVRNDGGDTRYRERLPKIAVSSAGAHETMGDDRHPARRIGARCVDIDMHRMTAEFNHFGMRDERNRLGRGGDSAQQEHERQ